MHSLSLRRLVSRRVLAIALPVALAAPSLAQGPVFQSPGISRYTNITQRFGQTTRFSTEFNPSFGFVIDGYLDYRDAASPGMDGGSAALRLFELNAAAYVDPNTWGYVVLMSHDGEPLVVEEAAAEFMGIPGNSTAKAGIFFVDFGKQMQTHLEELRTLERPLVLREYLGEELSGTGVQYDNWFALSDSTPLRFSVGVFGDLTEVEHGHGGEGEHGHGEEEHAEAERVVPSRKQLKDINFTARLTSMTEFSETSTFQLGGSMRGIPNFSYAGETATSDGHSNYVYGLDATYGWNDDTGIKRLTAGLEWLLADGDLSAEEHDEGAGPEIEVNSGSASGFYAFADFAWNRRSSAGVQFSQIDSLENTSQKRSEFDAYYTFHPTELRRIRLGYTLAQADGVQDDDHRVYLQFTAFFGAHSHGLNW